MKKELIAVSITACMLASSLSGFAADISGFSDIPDGWAHDAVVYAVENGILKGDNNQVFPDRLLTRAELAAIMNRSLNLSEKADISSYTDVSEEAWYYDDMAIAVNAGIFQGYDNLLNPEAAVTREEVFTVIARAYKLSSSDNDLSAYNDADMVSDWARPSAAALIEKGYIKGDNNNLRPNDNITRAELAQIIYNISGKSGSVDVIEPTVTDNPKVTSQPAAAPTATPRVSSSGGAGRGGSGGSSTSVTASHYVLMNIPYESFYGAENVSVNVESGKVNMDYDAVSSATNKVGNYGKSGGAYHSGKTAEIGEDGTVTAVGAENDAANKGVIWPVKVKDMSALESLGGTVITDSDEVTIATLGRGQTSSTDLKGYKTLTEAPDYSYYVLSGTPDYYIELTVKDGKPVFSTCSGKAITKENVEPTVSYGTNWGDIQLGLTDAEEVSDKQINAIVITAKDKNGETVTSGLIHLYNIWTYSDLAWKNDQIDGFNGAVITNIRYYCNNSADNVSELEYYVYDYPMNTELLPAYDGEVTAEFNGSSSIELSGLPEDIANLKAQVYHSTGGRNPIYTYLTPLVVDPADDDIDPTTVEVTDGKITITSGTVTNNAGETKTYGEPAAGTTYTIALSSDNYAPFTVEVDYEELANYVLMNIPYEAFYGAENVSVNAESGQVNMDYDAVSSATNKVGNYGKSGGAYHSGKTAEIGEDGTVTAVGAENDAANKGVIWPVKVKDMSALESLGGTVITDSNEVTIATLGRGQTSSTDLKGYKTLTEAADYSYYVLSGTPDYYIELTVEDGKPVFSTCSGKAITKENVEPTVSYGTNWGDIQLGLTDAEEVSDKQINAIVITAKDKNGETVTSGLIHLYNIWTYSDLAWKNDQIDGFNGAVITNIRYYCNNSADNVSELEYYVYDYPMNTELLPAYDGEVTAEFNGSSSIELSGLPEDIANLKAQVYHSTGGRNPIYTYLTPLVVDPADDDIDPTTVEVTDGKITITSGTVTNNAGETKTYGEPAAGTTYTIALSSDNYAPFTVEVDYISE